MSLKYVLFKDGQRVFEQDRWEYCNNIGNYQCKTYREKIKKLKQQKQTITQEDKAIISDYNKRIQEQIQKDIETKEEKQIIDQLFHLPPVKENKKKTPTKKQVKKQFLPKKPVIPPVESIDVQEEEKKVVHILPIKEIKKKKRLMIGTVNIDIPDVFDISEWTKVVFMAFMIELNKKYLFSQPKLKEITNNNINNRYYNKKIFIYRQWVEFLKNSKKTSKLLYKEGDEIKVYYSETKKERYILIGNDNKKIELPREYVKNTCFIQ